MFMREFDKFARYFSELFNLWLNTQNITAKKFSFCHELKFLSNAVNPRYLKNTLFDHTEFKS